MIAMQYRAFISYSHDDERWARWIQSALESYRIPKRLASRDAAGLGVTGRLYPIFRDRSELASSPDLTQSIRAALDDSAALIVVCSPSAAASKWVSEEIRHFQRRADRPSVHCLLVAGTTERADPLCAFPRAVLYAAEGQPLPDPLAADVSTHRDGKRGALLKIAAGLLDVGFDELEQRDAQRQIRRRGVLAVVSLAIAVLTLGFAIAAHFARADAELRRGQAERLIGFMLGDLRARLEPIGRLDILDSVGDEAMRYFDVLGAGTTEKELLSRTVALRQIGEVRFRQGRLALALRAFEESRDSAESLHALAGASREYLFELGQSEFWVGYTALEQANLEQAEKSFTKYMQYSRQLLRFDPDNPEYRLELSYAYSNMGTVSLAQFDTTAALEYFGRSAQLNKTLARESPDNLKIQLDLGNGYSWLGATHLQLGQLDKSARAYQRAVEILGSLHARNDSPLYAENLAQNLIHWGDVLMQTGEIDQAGELFGRAGELLDALVEHDPDNGIWRGDRAINAYHQGEHARVSGDPVQARAQLREASSEFRLLLETEPTDVRSAEFLSLTERSEGLLCSFTDIWTKRWR